MIVEEKSLHESLHGGTQVLHRFDNGYGASVIQNPYSYGGDIGLFEIAVLKWEGVSYSINYDTPVTDDVLGYVVPEEVEGYLRDIEALTPGSVEKYKQQEQLHELTEKIKALTVDNDLHPDVKKSLKGVLNGIVREIEEAGDA